MFYSLALVSSPLIDVFFLQEETIDLIFFSEEVIVPETD